MLQQTQSKMMEAFQAEAIHSPQSKIINATDNCIEELSSQWLLPSIEGQLSQT